MDNLEINKLFGGIYSGRRVLITGHTGFKGSWLALWLKSMGASVCGYSLDANTEPAHIKLLDLDLISEIGDIRDVERLNTVVKSFNPEIVFHLAAQPLVRLSYKEPIETYSTNVMGTLYLLEACRKVKSIKAIVVVTSDKCYENKEWLWGYRENDPMGGFDPYSASKGCTEIVTASYRNSYFNLNDYGIQHSVLLATARAGNVIGGGDWAEDRLIPDAMKAASEKQVVKIRNLHATRPWQHVLEPLSGYLLLGQKLLEGKLEFAGAWNFGPESAGVKTVGEVLTSIQSVWSDMNFKMDNGNHPHEAGLLKLDCSKANQLLKWRETLSIDETIEYTVQWYRTFYIQNKVITSDQLQNYLKKARQNNAVWIK
jgi:CDP-glucose 4,6-dehydratase